MARLSMVEAINLALKQEMKKDNKVLILGEDVGTDGGVFRVTDGLLKKYGKDRVTDTPLSESGIVGTSIGLAITGFKPAVEIQFSGFVPPALDQIISHASRMRNRSRGTLSVPMVIRCPYGGMVKALEHHSESMEAAYSHIPGLKVVIPARPYDAKGLLISAIRDPDPVLFMEPKRVYRSIKDDVPEKEYTIPLGQAKVVREGNDATVIAWGAMVKEALEAAEESEHDLEIIDLRTIKPFDKKTILESVEKTGRAIIAHEATKTGGWGAEIAATIAESGAKLKAPIKRVASPDVIIPLFKLEKYYFPDKKLILKAVEEAMS